MQYEKVCICSSMAFLKQFTALKQNLERIGHSVVIPNVEFKIDGDDTSVGAFFDRHGGYDAFAPDHEVWKRKGDAIKTHFAKIANSDCALITNWEKKGVPNYIGANTFAEMAWAFGIGKPVFVLNELPATSPYTEEMRGMQPTILRGDISKIG